MGLDWRIYRIISQEGNEPPTEEDVFTMFIYSMDQFPDDILEDCSTDGFWVGPGDSVIWPEMFYGLEQLIEDDGGRLDFSGWGKNPGLGTCLDYREG